MENQRILLNGKETTREELDKYISENGGIMNFKAGIEYNNEFISFTTQRVILNGKEIENKALANYIANCGGTDKFKEKVKLELNYNNTFIAYETRKITQWERVLRHLRDFGSLTSMEAFRDYGITRLSAIIYDLRHKKHLNITSDRINHINRYNEIVYFSNYTLED